MLCYLCEDSIFLFDAVYDSVSLVSFKNVNSVQLSSHVQFSLDGTEHDTLTYKLHSLKKSSMEKKTKNIFKQLETCAIFFN